MRDLVHLGVREGGSTITQQLARNSFTLGGRDLSRKILEAFVACRIESSYSKNQILGVLHRQDLLRLGLIWP